MSDPADELAGDYLPTDMLDTWKGRDPARPPRGDNARGAVLTRDDVVIIKTRLAAGERAADIARDFPMTSAKQIGRIKRRESWGHVRIDP